MKPHERKAVIVLMWGLGIIILKGIGGMFFAAIVNLRDRYRERKHKKNPAPYPLNTLARLSARECLRIEIDRHIH